ncbi:MAG TPA: anti-sigma factor [Candidatus Methylacidiphilales bacterium]|nr:anti-sigma factor [Candidatus Methylacidiphilales bacterium]
MSNPHLEELAALHALGLLDEAGRRELFEAAARDSETERLMREFAEAAAALAFAAPQVAPPSHCKQKILHSVPGRSAVVRFSAWLPYAIAAALMFLGIFDTCLIYSLRNDLILTRENFQSHQWKVTQDSARQDLAAVRVIPLDIHDPASKDPAFATAKITIVWNPALDQGIVTLRDVPPPPAGHDYQLWVLDPGALAPVNAGLLRTEGGSRSFTVAPPSTDKVGFAVSLEPAGGKAEPSGPILFAVAPGQG